MNTIYFNIKNYISKISLSPELILYEFFFKQRQNIKDFSI